MMNRSDKLEAWADVLLMEYEDGRKGLGEMKTQLDLQSAEWMGDQDPTEIDIEIKEAIERNKQDKSKINSMMNTMSESIEWMRIGREPNTFGGIDKKAAYQRKSMENMDLFKSLDIMPEERTLTEEEKQAIFNMMIDFTPRQRQCYLMHNAYMMTYQEIALELGLGRSTVQKHIERAKQKLSCRADVVQVS